jgi:hypothetical protein
LHAVDIWMRATVVYVEKIIIHNKEIKLIKGGSRVEEMSEVNSHFSNSNSWLRICSTILIRFAIDCGSLALGLWL